MKLDTHAVSQIKACDGIYRASDVARNYNVNRSTVKRIWDGTVHTSVSAAGDFPDLDVRDRASDKAEDLDILIKRGMSIDEAAAVLDIGRSTAYLMRGYFR